MGTREGNGVELELLNGDSAAKDGKTSPQSQPNRRIRVYKRRWLILLVSSMIQFVDQIIFLSFAPVANFADSFYGHFTVNYLAIICTAASIPASVIAPWFGSKFGLRSVMLYPAWVNLVGCGLRLASHVETSSGPLDRSTRFALVAAGQALAASSTPFAVYQPSKIAGSWFPQDERALAASVSAMSGMFGILFVNILCPLLVTHVQDLLKLNGLVAVLAGGTTVLTTVAVWGSAEPRLPPSETAGRHLEFWAGLRTILRNKAFLVLSLVMGGAVGCFTSLYTLMEQVMCSRGYSNQFAGLCISLLIGWGLVGAVLAGLAADRWKLFEEILKVTAGLASLAGVGIALTATQPGLDWQLAVLCSVFGFFAMAFYGVAMDVGAEITHPVAETTSAGILVFSGFLQFILYLVVLQLTQRPLPPDAAELEVCSVLASTGIDIAAYDMTVPLLVIAGLMCGHTALLTAAFRPTYARLETERSVQRALAQGPREEPPLPSPL